MIGIGIVGCGAISRKRHVPEFSKNKDCRIIGYYNPTIKRSQDMAEQYGGIVYQEYENMINDSRIDAVCICVPNNFHAAMTIKALRAGKHVLCEKPIAVSEEEAEQMIEEAEQAQRCLMTAHDMKYDEVHKKAKEILMTGKMGKVLSFETAFGHGGPEYWSVDNSMNSWFFQSGGKLNGVLGDLGIHKAHLISWLLNEPIMEVASISATRDKKTETGEKAAVSDNVICLLRMESGVIGTLAASWTYYEGFDKSTVFHCANGTMEIYKDEKYPLIVKTRDGGREFYPFENQDYSGVADVFIQNIKNDYSPEVETREGERALRVMLSCMQSQEKKQTVSIDYKK